VPLGGILFASQTKLKIIFRKSVNHRIDRPANYIGRFFIST